MVHSGTGNPLDAAFHVKMKTQWNETEVQLSQPETQLNQNDLREKNDKTRRKQLCILNGIEY